MVYYLILFQGFSRPLYSIITKKEIPEAIRNHFQTNAVGKKSPLFMLLPELADSLVMFPSTPGQYG